MKKSLILLGVLSMATAYAQEGRVGINTENPNATLEVAGVPTNRRVLDGIIAPRITGDQLKAKTYTANQTGALVYVTEPATTANQTGQTINVAGAGYYYFDGSVWQIFKAGDTDTQYTAGTGIAISDDNVISRTGFESVGTGTNRGWRLLDTNTRIPGKGSVDMMANNSGDQGVTGEYSVVGGYNNSVSAHFSAVFGIAHNIDTSYSLVGGWRNTTEESGGVLMSGQDNTITDSYYTIATGKENKIINSYAGSLLGYKNTLNNANYSFASGMENNVSSRYSLVGGWRNTTEESAGSFISGQNNRITASNYSSTIGINNIMEANSTSSYALGNSNAITNSSNAVAIGNSNIIKDDSRNSIAMGNSNQVHKRNAIALGIANITYNLSEIALGRYNFNTDAGNTDFDRNDEIYRIDGLQYFTLGTGTSDTTRRNAIIVLRNANTGIGLASDTTTPANSKPTEMLDVNGNVRVRGAGRTITEGATCTNEGTITYSNQSFYGCAGNVWKKLHN